MLFVILLLIVILLILILIILLVAVLILFLFLFFFLFLLFLLFLLCLVLRVLMVQHSHLVVKRLHSFLQLRNLFFQRTDLGFQFDIWGCFERQALVTGDQRVESLFRVEGALAKEVARQAVLVFAQQSEHIL